MKYGLVRQTILSIFFCLIFISLSFAQVDYKLPYPGGVSYRVRQGNNADTNGDQQPDSDGSHGCFMDPITHKQINPEPNCDRKSQFAFDFKMDDGSIIVAAADGTVSLVRDDSINGECLPKYANDANYIVIDHADNTRTVYLHLHPNSSLVRIGDPVLQGQPIAQSGQTGYSCGAHLHFQRQEPGKSWYTQSVPISFSDVSENGGVPIATHSYASGNYEGGLVIFADNFESYPVGSFPSGWSVYAIGGTVTTERSVSPTRSLRLDGTQGLGAFVYYPITISPTAHSVTVEVWTNSTRTDSNNATIRLGFTVPGGCGDGAGFQFGPNGRIYAADVPDDQQYILPTSGTYSANAWTQVRVVLDLVKFTYSIAVNGTVVGTDFPHRTQRIPTALCLGSDNNIPAGTGGGTTVYFDDVQVEEM